MKKDKAKVIDPVWTEDRVRDFLKVEPAENVAADFHMLLKSYQSMRSEDFEKYVTMFKDGGHDINAQNPDGRTVLSLVKEHQKSGEFAKILEQNGAK